MDLYKKHNWKDEKDGATCGGEYSQGRPRRFSPLAKQRYRRLRIRQHWADFMQTMHEVLRESHHHLREGI